MVMLGALPGQDDRLEAKRFAPLSPTHSAPGYAYICMTKISLDLRTAGAVVYLYRSQLSRTCGSPSATGITLSATVPARCRKASWTCSEMVAASPTAALVAVASAVNGGPVA
jgi:hypothetical protein